MESSSQSSLSSLKRAALPYLTSASHLPTPFLSAFLLVHLSAPLLANVGGSSMSSQVMLLGREYYQGSQTETWLVFAPVALHVGASALKRMCLPKPFARSSFSLLRISAYAIAITLPIHFITNRLHPTIPEFPIAALGPSELNYEFVKYGLQKWPWRSALLYTGLVGGTLIHSAEGAAILWETYVSKRMSERWERTKMTKRRLQAAVIALLTLSGAFAIWKEELTPLSSLLSRFDATHTASFFYRWQ